MPIYGTTPAGLVGAGAGRLLQCTVCSAGRIPVAAVCVRDEPAAAAASQRRR
jgi:hypothetical protein